MNGRNSTAFEALFQPQIEIRSIDTDENIRPVFQQAAQQLAPHGGDRPIMPQDFGIAAHR